MTLRFLKKLSLLAGVAAVGGIGAGLAAEAPRGGQIQIPASSLEDPAKIGISAHTNIRLLIPKGGLDAVQPAASAEPKARPDQGPPAVGYLFETPASLGCVYNLVAAPVAGCNPNTVTANPTGGGRAIAIVDAYHYPTALNDLRVFSAQFDLPLPTTSTFQVVFASGKQPAVNADWNVEAALDIEWAHAMAPQAKIYLVEAASSNLGDLLTAVWVAGGLVKAAGGGEVSMSWGGSEFGNESSYDVYFTQTGVVYFAAAGDGPGVNWPSASPNVVSVGGTSLSRNLSSGAFQLEVAWQSGGGGPSHYELLPTFQSAIAATAGAHRATPDVAANADPTTGVWVYDYPYWYIVGGTSVATPVWAGIVNAAGAAGAFATTSQAELATLYANSGKASDFRGILAVTCGPNEGYLVAAGWNFCTGIGSPQGRGGK